MNKRAVSWYMTILAALCAVIVWAQGVLVCPFCGHEVKPGATACAHCGAKLPKPEKKAAPPPAAAPDVNAEIGRLAAAEVKSDVRKARAAESQQPAVALCYYQNALALMRLVPAGTFPDSVGEAILKGNDRVMQALSRGPVPCRKCGGTGKFQLDLGKVDKHSGVKSIGSVACPACQGRGCFIGWRPVEEVKMAILRGRGEFERQKMVEGEVKLGRAYVPTALEKPMTNRQRALVMTGMPSPCPACQFTGRQACTTCRGAGWVSCDYEGCEHGVLKETKKSGARVEKRMNEEQVKKCPKCEGLGEIFCSVCKGTGSVACKKCGGSGLAPRCSRCSGSGLLTCPKCKGTGSVKGETCPECKGETVILCPTCHGEGAISR